MTQRSWLLLFFLLLPILGYSAQLKTYQAETTQPIVDKDVVYARDVAFQNLRRTLIDQAVLDLLGPEMYEMYRSAEFTQGKLRSSRFLNSVKVLKEAKEGREFFMSINGQVALSDLSESLRRMNLVLKNDSWQKVTLLVESPLVLPEKALIARLKIFHLKVESVKSVNLDSSEPRDTPQQIESLFTQHPKARLIFLIETQKSTDTGEDSIGLRVLRKSGYRQLGVYSKTVGTVAEDGWSEVLEDNQPGFLALFSLTSIQQASFSEGEQSMVRLEVSGLDSPFLRNQFEDHILRDKSEIRHFGLARLARAGAVYQVQVRRGADSLVNKLNKPNPYFHFEITDSSASQIQLSAASKFSRSQSVLKEFSSDEDMLNQIAALLGQDPETLPPEEWVPLFIEVEPNDNAQKVNILGPNILVTGRVSSRADADIFELKPKKGSKTLSIVWGRVGKTSLSPQLKLYDQRFGYLNQYNLEGIKQTTVQYRFQEPPTAPIYLRVADRVGFIQGETGGFKSYQYLINYKWK